MATTTAPAPSTTEVANVPLADIVPGDNDRTKFDADALARLAATIDTYGLAQPITVRPVGDRYEIVAGERRFRAVTMLGWDTIPALVRTYDDDTASAVMLIENASREDLDPVEEGQAYAKRMADGLSAEEVAEQAGVSIVRLRFRVKLLDLIDEARQMVSTGALPLRMAQELHGLDANRQRIALKPLARRDMTWQQFREMCLKLKDDQDAEAQDMMFDVEQFLQAQDAAELAAETADEKASRSQLVEIIRKLAATVGPNSDVYDEAMAALATA